MAPLIFSSSSLAPTQLESREGKHSVPSISADDVSAWTADRGQSAESEHTQTPRRRHREGGYDPTDRTNDKQGRRKRREGGGVMEGNTQAPSFALGALPSRPVPGHSHLILLEFKAAPHSALLSLMRPKRELPSRPRSPNSQPHPTLLSSSSHPGLTTHSSATRPAHLAIAI